MAQTCKICRHPRRLDLERAIVNGTPLRAISRQFGPSRSAIARHRSHIAEAICEVQEIREQIRTTTLLDDVRSGERRAENLYRRAEEILTAAMADNDRADAIQAVKAASTVLAQARAFLQVRGELTGELDRAREFRPFSVQILTPWAGVSADQLPMVRTSEDIVPDGLTIIGLP